ncbi:hypothetical protein M408DRAFT_319857 [Serendipita vermifera MAFF 305830]|uniref:Mitochondrial carrier n=1 Tax=Serendipita vermifera MAFF 305830 TaxID=933852 RepID=A0A0C3AG11_SERVB|nr:hypothetical protein M408DRAFT_319857 [Serendipita vermifera MAFF 305830]
MYETETSALPFWANFVAGAIAGVTEILTFYPLDVVKTRMQLDTSTKSVGLVGTFRTIVAQEGVGRLYRGLGPPLLLEAPKRAVKFAANDFWSKTYRELFNKKEMNQSLSILTGLSAGATESFVVFRSMLPKADTPQGTLMNNFISGTVGGFVGTAINTPFDVVKSRIQGASKPAPGQVLKYNWTYPALVTIAREEGVRALWKGFTPKVLRLAPGGGVLLLVVEFTLSSFRTMLGPPYM